VHAGVEDHTAWIDNIEMWKGLPVEEAITMKKDIDEWKTYVHDVANPQIEDGYKQSASVASMASRGKYVDATNMEMRPSTSVLCDSCRLTSDHW